MKLPTKGKSLTGTWQKNKTRTKFLNLTSDGSMSKVTFVTNSYQTLHFVKDKNGMVFIILFVPYSNIFHKKML